MFFWKKKKEEVKVEEPVVVLTGKERKCESCGNLILSTDRYTKLHGHYFHKVCWKRDYARAMH